MTHSPRILIHPGYPKSGSSSLQQNIMMRHPDICYLAGESLAAVLSNKPAALERARRFYDELIYADHPDLTALTATWREVFLPLCDAAKLNVVSDERFVINYRPPSAIAADLAAIIGDAQILMVVRDQVGLLRSQYDMSPFYERDPKRRFKQFGPWLDEMLANADDNMASSLRYGDVVEIYARHFGVENVVVAAFEGLFSDEMLQAELAEVLGIDARTLSMLATVPREGSFENHGYKKVTRRILGARPAGDYLSPRQHAILRSLLRKMFPGRKTHVETGQAELIRSFYKGHRLDDLRRRTPVTVVPTKSVTST